MKQSPPSRRRYSVLRAGALVCAVLGGMATPWIGHAGTTLVVDGDGQATATDCDANGSAYQEIQAAVDAAEPGDTIIICPGTYVEQVVVTTSDLTIRGTDLETTVLQSPSPAVANSTTLVPPTSTPEAAVILVDGVTGVSLANFTVDGDGEGAGNFECPLFPFFTGINYRNSSGTVAGVRITRMMSATGCAFGIRAQSSPEGAAGVVWTGNHLDHYSTFGMACSGLNTTCAITDNVLTGLGPINEIQGGIAIRAGAVAVITGNEITDHYSLVKDHGAAGFSVGIFLVAADPKTNPHLLQDNVFRNNQLNVQRVR